MSIVDLAACVQGEGESTTRSVRRVSEILHSSDRIKADSTILTLEGNCRFQPLRLKLGRLKRHCNDMGTLMAALVKYADSDSTKDPESDDDKPGKGKKNGNTKGQQHNPTGHNKMVSGKQILILILSLTPIHRVMVSVVRESRPQEGQSPVLIRSA